MYFKAGNFLTLCKCDTDYPKKSFKKIQNFEHAQKGPKWPKLGPNTFYFCIFGLKMSQLYVKSDNDYSEKISKKSKILNMPKMAQNGPKWPKLGILGMFKILDFFEISSG